MPRKKLPVTADWNAPTDVVEAHVGQRFVFGVPLSDDYGQAYVPRVVMGRVGEIIAEAINAHGDELRLLLDAKPPTS